ncbi:hypothetical protein WMY93_004518 [Mugilogobius chulae]|uniref:Radial spoke head 14 homolog n=1 Tax=Mugilogobius chulae TaxID=88201 RepID=A0AAW0PNV8_9GOBI
MAFTLAFPGRAPVAYGRRAVPQLFEELQKPEPEDKMRALNSLCDLLHDPEHLYQTVRSGLLETLNPLLRDPDSTVRTRTCDLLRQVAAHSIGCRALLLPSLVASLSLLLDDPHSGCRVAVHRILNLLALLPSGADVLLSLVPKLMLRLTDTLLETNEEDGAEELGSKETAQEEGSKETTLEEGSKEEDEVEENDKGVEERKGKDGNEEIRDEEGETEQGFEESKEENEELEEDENQEEIKRDKGQKEGEKEQGDKQVNIKQEQQEQEEEEMVLLLSTLTRCSYLDPLPALASDGVKLLRDKLAHSSAHVRREAAAAMLALSIPMEGKQQLCDLGVLSDLIPLLQDQDTEVRANAAGVCAFTFVVTTGKVQGVELGLIPILLDIVSLEELSTDSLVSVGRVNKDLLQRRKTLLLYCLRALSVVSDYPAARRLLLEERPLLERRTDTDPELRQATQSVLKAISWSPL